MNQEHTNQQNNPTATMSNLKMDTDKIAEQMPIDPGELNICLSCE